MSDRNTADRLLFLLKTRGPQGISELGSRLSISAEGARQHLYRLREEGLVETEDEPAPRGRPKRFWRLTEAGHRRFPDSHASLTLELIGAVRELYGDEGLERLIARRERDTLASYRAEMTGLDNAGARVARLAELRSREGYMAEVLEAEGGGWLLIENHCPICAAATTCQGFCRSELEVFQQLLGPDLRVERTDHILAGARRCAYRINP